VGGQGEGDQRTYYDIGGGTGLDLREVFVDAKDINPDGMTTAQYKAALLQRAQENLNEAIISETLECETDAAINFTYKEENGLTTITNKEPAGSVTYSAEINWGDYDNRFTSKEPIIAVLQHKENNEWVEKKTVELKEENYKMEDVYVQIIQLYLTMNAKDVLVVQ
jgi:hypothetical protein